MHLMLGLITMASLVASLFFLRFWRSTKDEFFLLLSISFFMQAVSRAGQGVVDTDSEYAPFVYLLRLAAFSLILWAIVRKNWPRKAQGSVTGPGVL
jgi:hypothetical protein